MEGGHCTSPIEPPQIQKNLPDAGQTKSTLCVGVLLGRWWKFFYGVEMNSVLKPACYDSVPACLCRECFRYDMYMASCVPRTVGESTSGLAVVDSSCSVVSSSAPSSSVAVSSSAPCVVSSSVPSSSVAVVSSSAPFGSLARSRTVVAPTSSVAARPVVVSRPVPFGSLARPVSVSPVRPSPVVVPSVSSGPAGSGSAVPRFVRPCVPSVGSSFGLPFGRPVGLSFVPVVCFVLAFVPVLIPSPFGLVWSFLPVWR